MKDTFFKLKQEKQERITAAILTEFARSGYEKTSLDSIIRMAGISKGGLYEYIDTKEDLFEYALDFSYSRLYQYIREHTASELMPKDPVLRTRRIAAVAVDYYLSRVDVISFLVRSSRIEQGAIKSRVSVVFNEYFHRLYEDCEYSAIKHDPSAILSLLGWLLIKTRNDFIERLAASSSREDCKAAYIEEWDFFISVLSSGIYRRGSDSPPDTKE